jgi:hypothetical protein
MNYRNKMAIILFGLSVVGYLRMRQDLEHLLLGGFHVTAVECFREHRTSKENQSRKKRKPGILKKSKAGIMEMARKLEET